MRFICFILPCRQRSGAPGRSLRITSNSSLACIISLSALGWEQNEPASQARRPQADVQCSSLEGGVGGDMHQYDI